MKKLLICIISKELLPNVISTLHETPDLVLAVTSNGMRYYAKRLKAVLSEKGVAVKIHARLPDGDFAAQTKFAAELRDSLTPGSVVVNLTGGTKLMTLAFMQAFRERPDTVGRYVDTQRQNIETVFPEPRLNPLPDILDCDTYLRTQGFTAKTIASEIPGWKARTEKRRNATMALAKHPKAAANIIGEIIRDKSPNTPRSGFAAALHAAYDDSLTESLIEHQLVRRKGETLELFDSNARKYLNGQWLEEYAWLVASDVGLHNVRSGMRGTWQSGRHENELDLVAVHNNRLLVVECKTSQYIKVKIKKGKPKNLDESAKDLYKIDSVASKLRGLYGKTLFLTQFEILDAAQKRAQQLGISVLAGNQLSSLEDHLLTWMHGDSGKF